MAEQYRRYSQSPEFRPRAVEELSGVMQEDYSQRLQQLKTYNSQVMQRNQNILEDARFAGQDLESLGKLSSTLVEMGKEQYKRDVKAKEIGEQAGALYPGFNKQDPNEQALIDIGEQQNRDLVPSRDALVQTDPIAAQALEDRRRIGRGLDGEKGLLKDASNRYPTWFLQYINSNNKVTYKGKEYTVAQLLAEPGEDFYERYQAVTEAGRYKFIEENNLQYTTKKNFVEIFGPTVSATENYNGTNLLTRRIKQGQEDALIEQDALLRDQVVREKGVMSVSDLQGVWNTSDGTYITANTGLTITQSNARRVKVLAKAILENNDPVTAQSNLRALGLVQQVPGQKGSELGRLYGTQIQEAVVEAAADESKRDGVLADQILTGLYKELEDPNLTPSQRLDKIKAAASKLRGLNSRVGFTEADRLLGNSATLSLDPDSEINDARLRDQIARDDLPDPELVENGYRAGLYSKTAYDSYQKAYAQSEKARQPETKATFDGFSEGIEREAELAFGLKKDPSGRWTLIGKGLSYVPPRLATNLLTSLDRDLIRERNRILRNSTATTDEERAKELDKGLSEWYKANFETEGGKYYLNGFWTAPRSQRTNAKKGKATFGPAFEQFNDPTYRTSPSSLPVQQQANFNLGQPMPDSVAFDYSPTRGDTLFGTDTLMSMKESWEGGVIDSDLKLAAEGVNMSPLDLINYELIANGEPTIKPKVDAAAITSSMQGAHAFELAGFPSKSAGFLAAAVDSQGGWEDPESLQLEKWGEELRLENPQAYRLLMNPNASMRNIKLAMSMVLPDLPDVSAYANYLTA